MAERGTRNEQGRGKREEVIPPAESREPSLKEPLFLNDGASRSVPPPG
jgi:hypothetical protein